MDRHDNTKRGQSDRGIAPNSTVKTKHQQKSEDRADNAVVYVKNLQCRYNQHYAVKGINFVVQPGEVFALLGTNGAGKTTTLDVLEGYRRPDGGAVQVFGLDPEKDRDRLAPRIGIMLQEAGFFESMTVEQTVRSWSRFHPKRVAETSKILTTAGLEHKRDTRVDKLSGGEKRRLDLALSLMGNPDLLFLDEPTTGMDPEGRQSTLAMIKERVSNGMTVVLTTHYLEEAQLLADHVAILHRGRIVKKGTLAEVGVGGDDKTIHWKASPEDIALIPEAFSADIGKEIHGLCDVEIRTRGNSVQSML